MNKVPKTRIVYRRIAPLPLRYRFAYDLRHSQSVIIVNHCDSHSLSTKKIPKKNGYKRKGNLPFSKRINVN